jgi:hypothetical protein
LKNKKAIRLCPYGFENKKAMGPIRSPMAFHPGTGLDLWVTLVKIKIKKIEVREGIHVFSFNLNIKHIGSRLSREF